MSKRKIVLLTVLAGFTALFWTGYHPYVIWNKFMEVQTNREGWNSTNMVIFLKPLLAYAVGAYIGAALPWIFKEPLRVETFYGFHPWAVALGATLGCVAAFLASLVPYTGAAVQYLFYAVFSPVYAWIPWSYRDTLLTVYAVLVSATIPFLFAFIGATAGFEAPDMSRKKSFLQRIVYASAILLALVIALVVLIRQDDYLRISSENFYLLELTEPKIVP